MVFAFRSLHDVPVTAGSSVEEVRGKLARYTMGSIDEYYLVEEDGTLAFVPPYRFAAGCRVGERPTFWHTGVETVGVPGTPHRVLKFGSVVVEVCDGGRRGTVERFSDDRGERLIATVHTGGGLCRKEFGLVNGVERHAENANRAAHEQAVCWIIKVSDLDDTYKQNRMYV